MKILIVVDMQNDFITGSLGSESAQKIVPYVAEKIKNFKGLIVVTRDTHYDMSYLNTQEGLCYPTSHCEFGTHGWKINEEILFALTTGDSKYITRNKTTFGLSDWGLEDHCDTIESIEICGLCTDICVVTNALILRTLYPETPVIVDVNACAGTTAESHQAALLTMKKCLVNLMDRDVRYYIKPAGNQYVEDYKRGIYYV